jgi:outer membrane protein assembly factor BamB
VVSLPWMGTGGRAQLLLLSICGVLVGMTQAFVPPEAAAKRTFTYDVPVQKGSPWPSMRRDRRNTGFAPIPARYRRGHEPWRFRTGKGIFSTPVIDRKDTAYFGSADRRFYAVDRDGSRRWKLNTGEVIDSAALLGARDRLAGSPTITFGSADEYIYRLRDPRKRRLARKRRIVWRFRTDKPPQGGQIVNWWEGNVVTGPDGTLYAGNTGGGLYAIDPEGKEKWNFPTGNAVWSAAAIADDGDVFFGSMDANLYGIDGAGQQLWSKLTIGFNAASAAIGGDGTVYLGSFDGNLYALDPDTGAERWSFATDDHIYASAALEEAPDGTTVALYVASADGSIYKLDRNGELVWRYDTGDPIRSSPVLGLAPKGEKGRILYVGSSNGKLYAIDTRAGTRRWSYDTTPKSRALGDRNDLNGSPALGKRGVWIGGEHGFLHHVPYDYCLSARAAGGRDNRCETDPGERFGDRLTRIFPVSAGGSTEPGGYSRKLPAATALTGRLVVRRDGETVDARMLPQPSQEELVAGVDPPFDFSTQLSADGRYIHILPDGFLEPGRQYRIDLAGQYTNGSGGGFSDRITLRTKPQRRGRPPLETGSRRVSAFNLRRLSLPLPPLLPSVNQIGFDSYDWIAGTLERTRPDANGEGELLIWVVGSREDRRGRRVADGRSEFAFPLAGRYAGDSLILEQRGFELLFTFGPVPLELLQFRGQLNAKRRMKPGASVYGEVNCPEVPNLGPLLIVAGLCNNENKLISAGTYLTNDYRGPANRKPTGVKVGEVEFDPPSPGAAGFVRVDLALKRNARFGANRHTANVLLVDGAGGEPVSLDYKELTTIRKQGNRISGLELRLPAGTQLPERLRAYVVADVFPLASRMLR